MVKGYTSQITASFVCLLLGTVPATLAAQEQPLLARFWATGLSSARANYESNLARAALESTTEKFGPYSMEVTYMDVSFDRGRRVVALGDQANFFSNPLPDKPLPSDDELQVIPTPVMHGLLGYRKLIVRKEDLPRFKHLKSFSDLQQLRAGQVTDWVDNSVFTENSLPLVESTSFDKLFFMLSRKRFDYISLSAAEAEQTLAEIGDRFGALAVVPDAILFYPFPVLFQVSKNNPILLKRLKIGLDHLQRTGAMERLFRESFKDALQSLENPKLIVFQLKNSQVPAIFGLDEPSLVTTKQRLYSPAFEKAHH